MSEVLNLTASYLRGEKYRPIHAGDDYRLQFTAQEKDINDNISPIPLAKVWFTIKRTEDDPDTAALLQLTSDSITEIELTDANAGQFTVIFTPENTGAIPGTWPFDIQIEDQSGDIITLARGEIELVGQTTRTV